LLQFHTAFVLGTSCKLAPVGGSLLYFLLSVVFLLIITFFFGFVVAVNIFAPNVAESSSRDSAQEDFLFYVLLSVSLVGSLRSLPALHTNKGGGTSHRLAPNVIKLSFFILHLSDS
jgi:hypothetical protein